MPVTSYAIVLRDVTTLNGFVTSSMVVLLSNDEGLKANFQRGLQGGWMELFVGAADVTV
jgi:hypothetical protein